MGQMMENSSFGIIIIRNSFEIEVMNTKLNSQNIWELKDNNTEFYLKWSIAAYASPYRCGTRRCDLCLTEKYLIARAEQKNLLNKRIELMSKCRHRNKYILKNL